MKAARITEYGDVSVVKVVETDKPTCKPGQVLVQVYASSLNPFDTMVRAGYLKDSVSLTLPVTLGGDIAGEIVELGEGVEDFTIGDKVFGQANVVAGNSGAFAEFAATSVDQVGKAPANITLQEAASLPLVGVSALQALTEHSKLRAGQKLFIHGGTGGIGAIAVQIAKYIGAYVAVTATGDDVERARALGADEVIDYKQQDFIKVLKDYDAAYDTVGGGDFVKMFGMLKEGGVAVTMVASPEKEKAKEYGVVAINQMTSVTTQKLDELCKLVEAGVVKPNVGRVFPLENIQEAFTARETHGVSGKIVLNINE
jgi:alcohol dehydrogenase